MKQEKSAVVKTIYIISMSLLPFLILLFFILRTDKAYQILLNGGMKCVFLSITGHPCPGCGGTRAAMNLVRFNIIESIKMNASVVTGAVLYMFFVIYQTFRYRMGKLGISEKQLNFGIYFFIAVIVINWIVKLFIW